MTIANDLFDYLEAQTSGVTFAQTLAAPDATPPLVEITRTDNRRTRTTGSTITGLVTELEIECWHTTTGNAAALAATLIALLQDYTGSLDGTSNVLATRIFNESQGSDGAADLFYSNFTVNFTHR